MPSELCMWPGSIDAECRLQPSWRSRPSGPWSLGPSSQSFSLYCPSEVHTFTKRNPNLTASVNYPPFSPHLTHSSPRARYPFITEGERWKNDHSVLTSHLSFMCFRCWWSVDHSQRNCTIPFSKTCLEGVCGFILYTELLLGSVQIENSDCECRIHSAPLGVWERLTPLLLALFESPRREPSACTNTRRMDWDIIAEKTGLTALQRLS